MSSPSGLVWLVTCLLSASLLVLGPACTSSGSDCTCSVENSGQRRTLACGETVCVGGLSFVCTDDDAPLPRGACTDTAPPLASAPADAGSSAPPPPPDRSCDDLRTFCSTGCTRPAAASSDCHSAASSGNPQTCAAWRANNAVVCRP